MAEKSNIQWTDATWNVAVGCTKVDADCKYCYMYRESLNETRYDPHVVRKTKTVFNLPLKLKEPSLIFTSSLTDFYHEGVDSYRHEAFDIIRKCPQHIFQILTKRPERIVEQTPADILNAHNVWFGTSVGFQAGMSRIGYLLEVDCKVKFISFEPLYEELDFASSDLQGIDWVIIGGESGNIMGKYKYRPCKIDWFLKLISQIPDETGVFVKQLGTHLAKELGLSDRHGGDFEEEGFPRLLKIRQFPNGKTKEEWLESQKLPAGF